MKTIVFIVPSLTDSHYKNRVIEFIEQGFDVKVYGFTRVSGKPIQNLPNRYTVLGSLVDEGYIQRIKLYYTAFRQLGKKYKNQEICFFLGGLDIAMFFHFLNPSIQYIYEECDLVHTYMGKVKNLFEWFDKWIIKKSILTITTSEGFIKYHFQGNTPKNVCLVENKLNPTITDYPIRPKRVFNKENITIGFVGMPRFDSVYNFIDVFCKHFPNNTFHIYGGPISEQFESLRKYSNCIFHGFFKNPVDLPEIYSSLDLVLSTYDIKYENVRYAEPNKIYESIYFETPIIVSSSTFLAEKVQKIGIGYDIDALNEAEIVEFVNSLTKEALDKKIEAAKSIEKRETLNINDHLYDKLNALL